MSSETTNFRYKRALQEIAAGVDDPQAIAIEALRSRKGAPTYQWKAKEEAGKQRAQARRNARADKAIAAYREWLALGRPPIAEYARMKGTTRSSMDRLLWRGEYSLNIPYRLKRLSVTRNRTYDTFEEIYKARYGEDYEEVTDAQT